MLQLAISLVKTLRHTFFDMHLDFVFTTHSYTYDLVSPTPHIKHKSTKSNSGTPTRPTVFHLEQHCDNDDGCQSLLEPRGSAVNEAAHFRENPCNEGTAYT